MKNVKSSSKKEKEELVGEEKKIKLLNEYKKLLDDGVIGKEEFEKMKKKILEL